MCVCVIEVQWQAICSGGEEWGRGWQDLAAPKSTHKHIHSLSHSTGIRDSPDRDVTPLPYSSLFGTRKILTIYWVAMRPRTASFQTFLWAPHGDSHNRMQWYFLPEWDLDLIRAWFCWAWCCRHAAKSWGPCNRGIVKVNESFMWTWKERCFSWR